MNFFLRSAAHGLIPGLLLLALIACGPRKNDASLNRAGAYCAALGYTTGFGLVEGVSRQVCVFSETKKCEVWDFYRARCGRRYSRCEKKGYNVRPRVEKLERGEIEYAVCLFDDGSECVEQDFVEGRCKRTECKKWRFAEGGCVRAPPPV